MTSVGFFALLLKRAAFAQAVTDAGALFRPGQEGVGLAVHCHDGSGVKNEFSLAVAVPDVNKTEGRRFWPARFFTTLDKLTVHAPGHPLEAQVDPVNLDLKRGCSQNSDSGLLVDDQGRDKKKTEEIESRHKITSQGFRRRGPACLEDQPVRLRTM